MNYIEYMSSNEWRKKRETRLELDGNRCRLCDEDGSSYKLEVHHRPSSYLKIPNESVEDDLITICSKCHDFVTDIIREKRYRQREYVPTIIEANIQVRQQEKTHGLENFEIPVEVVRPIDNAQRADSRPNEQMVEIDKGDFVQAKESGRRL